MQTNEHKKLDQVQLFVLGYDEYMPRTLRQFEVGGIYHVINRGVERRKIFMKVQDYSRFTLALEFFNRDDFIYLWDLIAKAGPGPALAIRSQR